MPIRKTGWICDYGSWGDEKCLGFEILDKDNKDICRYYTCGECDHPDPEKVNKDNKRRKGGK